MTTLARRKATHARHYCEQPQITDADGSKHWITRAANFVTVVSEAAKGAVLVTVICGDVPEDDVQRWGGEVLAAAAQALGGRLEEVAEGGRRRSALSLREEGT